VAFRGYFALNGVEIANSSRVVAHVGADIPTTDVGIMRAGGDCSMVPTAPGSLLATVPPSSVPIAAGRLLATVPDGSRLYGPGLAEVGECWTPDNLCFGCRQWIGYDDSWDGLAEFLADHIYRPELSPWYSTRVPESAEFGGIWVMEVKGLDTAPSERQITENAGDGGVAGPHRDASRKITFDAILIACSNAGLTYGLQWLACQLRATNDRTDSTLRYLAAHPASSAADPASLVREVHGVVMTQEPQINDAVNPGHHGNRQATMYRVSWELTATLPHAYSPPVELPVEWDTIATQPIRWVHATDCDETEPRPDEPRLFSTECPPETITVVTSPPPVCGGCLPVCAIVTHTYELPTMDYPVRCSETVATVRITNTGTQGLTLQAHWQRCSADKNGQFIERWPIQVSGLPPTAELVLDGVSGRYWVNYAGRRRRPFGIVGTPKGSPWRPAVLDRALCWQFVAQTDGDASFDVSLSLADREA